jgi:parallel beta-helix repeat protein
MNRIVASLGVIAAGAVATVLVTGLPVGADTPSGQGGSTRPAPPVSISKADADQESALVAAEDRRILDVRTVSTLARWQNRSQKSPYRLSTPAGYTLVLTPRSANYGFADLLKLQPQTLVALSDGSYLLSEHVVVMAGAELTLSRPEGLTLRLASSSEGFTSIVSMGGRLKILGTAAKPVKITSWDTRAAKPDDVTADGRAYLRAIGGQLQISHTELSQLGFWSGRTGGLSLTGTNRPNTGSLDADQPSSTDLPALPGKVGDTTVIPAGPLPTGATTSADDSDDSGLSYVSGRIDNTTVTGNAFGLFVSGADGVDIDQSTFADSQITGIDFHRFVRSSIIQRTTSNRSGGDGISLGRATQGVQISQSTAKGNAHDGFVLAGEALADGPSAVGSPTGTYGNNSISNSTADGNGHYGIHVKDGFNMTVSSNHVSNSSMGIVVSDNAKNISVTSNQISGVDRHAIALLDGVKSSTVTGNVVEDGPIYLRNSQAKIQGNTITGADGHGVSVVGVAAGTVISYNVVGGSGSSAIDTARANGSVETNGNSDKGWHDTTAIVTRIKQILVQPMTLVWGFILVLVLLSMAQGLRRRPATVGTHPYAHQSSHLLRSIA